MDPLWKRAAHRAGAAVGRVVVPMGRGKRCPVCGHQDVRFRSHGKSPVLPKRKNARCPSCGSLERHRLLWEVLQRGDLQVAGRSLLHFAPERFLRAGLAEQADHYVTLDLLRTDVTLRGSITALPFRDGAFDALLCVHVLEHVPDDAAAMQELCRVLSPDGWAVVDVPLNQDPDAVTHEDLTADAATRTRLYGQSDHVRLYGNDLPRRLERAGFEVAHVLAADAFDRRTLDQLSIHATGGVFVCRPRRT